MVNRKSPTANDQSLHPNCNLVAVVGPTASGKSALAINLAKKYRGEIICADSRTIYRGLDIGTAKPTATEQEGVPHFGLDLVYPDESYSAADFQAYANQKIAEIRQRGNLPILVGGSGLYIDGVLYQYEFGAASDPGLRAELDGLDLEELQKRIKEAGYEMPENDQNKRYLIRAIEQGGVNRKKQSIDRGTLIIGLNPGRQELESRISLRTNKMIDDGVLEEVRQIEEDYSWDIPAASGNVYRALRPYIDGSTSDLEECLAKSVTLDLQLAKRQVGWFSRNKSIQWFEDADSAEQFLDSAIG